MSVIEKDTFYKIFGSGLFKGEPSVYTGTKDVKPLMSLSRTFRPKNVIEIGIQRGATAKCILDNSPWIKRYIGIDLTPNSMTSLSIQQDEVPHIAGECVSDDFRVKLILKPNGSRDIAPKFLPTADLIFIDGDHSFEGVMADTVLARKVIRKGGIICWHDYENQLVPEVTEVINLLNKEEGDHICHIKDTAICFQFCRSGR